MNEKAIGERLVEHGQKLFDAPRPKAIRFTGVSEADAWLSDLDARPHAFVLANIMNRQTKATPFLIPYWISEKLHGFSMQTLGTLSQADVQRLMAKPKPLHRFVDIMSGCFYSAVQRIKTQYGNDAGRIWRGKPSSAEVVYRFLEFDGVGPKIGNLAANDLARNFKIPFMDYFSIDISADVHVRRVFARLGLCASDASVEQVVYKARSIHPTFPGLMDFPTWEIGKTWCKAHGPQCEGCYMSDLCPKVNGRKR